MLQAGPTRLTAATHAKSDLVREHWTLGLHYKTRLDCLDTLCPAILALTLAQPRLKYAAVVASKGPHTLRMYSLHSASCNVQLLSSSSFYYFNSSTHLNSVPTVLGIAGNIGSQLDAGVQLCTGHSPDELYFLFCTLACIPMQ